MPHRCVADVGNYTGWTPPFQYRIGYILNVILLLPYPKVEDEIGTEVMQRWSLLGRCVSITTIRTDSATRRPRASMIFFRSWNLPSSTVGTVSGYGREFHRYTAKRAGVWQILGLITNGLCSYWRQNSSESYSVRR